MFAISKYQILDIEFNSIYQSIRDEAASETNEFQIIAGSPWTELAFLIADTEEEWKYKITEICFQLTRKHLLFINKTFF